MLGASNIILLLSTSHVQAMTQCLSSQILYSNVKFHNYINLILIVVRGTRGKIIVIVVIF